MVTIREDAQVRSLVDTIPQLFFYKNMILPPVVNNTTASSVSGGSKRNDYRNDYIANEGKRGTKFKNATGLDNCKSLLLLPLDLNSCYANTTLQTLARIDEFSRERLRKKPGLSSAQSELYVLCITS
jgi:hypothetical protein